MATVTKRAKAVTDEYLNLVREFPLVRIKSDAHLRSAFRVVDRLSIIDEDRMPTAQSDYLMVLSDLIERYENELLPTASAFSSAAEVLKYLCEQAGLTASDLGQILGNRPLGAALLRGSRAPTKSHIAKLCEHFKVSSDLFLLTAST